VRHVNSRDPRKPLIVDAMKKASGASRVSELYETGSPHAFKGRLLKYHGGKYEVLGYAIALVQFVQGTGGMVLAHKVLSVEVL
jgi:hypothetical protein